MKSGRPDQRHQARPQRESLGKRILRRLAYRVIQLTLVLVAAACAVVGAASHFQRAHDPNVDAINLEISSSQFSAPVKSHLDAALRRFAPFNRRAANAAGTTACAGIKVTERASTEVKLKNTGNDEITYVKWECLLFDPKDADHPIQRLSFQTEQQDKPLRAGEVRTYQREFAFRQQLPDAVRSRFRIVRVVYASGDTWQRPDSR